MPSRLSGIIFALILSLTPAYAASDAASAQTYTKWHDVCLGGDTDEIDTQIKKFEAQLAKNPNDHLAEAFLGSACALRAKAGSWPPTKLKFLKLGKQHLDAAVAAAPDDARVRMVRAIAYYKVPERFGVRPTSLKDFEILIPIAKNPKGRLTTNEQQAILYHGHLAYHEDARPGAAELKTSCHKLAPDSSYGKLTR
jgi:hypothetical protein